MKWSFLAVSIILSGALYMRFNAIEELDPNLLPPASAGLPQQGQVDIIEPVPGNLINCDETLQDAALDGVGSARESSGWALEAVSFTNTSGNVRVVIAPEAVGILNFALYNCDGEYVPSGTFFPGAGPLRLAHGYVIAVQMTA